MKYKLRTETTDIPAECFKASREDFIAKWSKKLYQKSPQDVREQFLGEIWDMENKSRLVVQAETPLEIVPRTAQEQLESVLNAKTEDEAIDAISTVMNEVGIKNTRKSKKNGVPGDTTQSPAV